MDCDEQHEPAAIPRFVAEIEKDDADVISGSRYMMREKGEDSPPADRRAINAQITDEINSTLGLNPPLTDSFCGFKAYRVAAVQRLPLDEPGYAFPMQFWVQAVAKGLRIREIPVRLIYNDLNRTFGGPLNDPGIRLKHYREVLKRELDRVGSGDRPPHPPNGAAKSPECSSVIRTDGTRGVSRDDLLPPRNGSTQSHRAGTGARVVGRVDPPLVGSTGPSSRCGFVPRRPRPPRRSSDRPLRAPGGVLAPGDPRQVHRGTRRSLAERRRGGMGRGGSGFAPPRGHPLPRAGQGRLAHRPHVGGAPGGRGPRRRQVPLCLIPAESPAAAPAGATDPRIERALSMMRESLAAHARETSAARQVARAASRCLDSIVPLAVLYATEISRTSLFAWILEQIARRPRPVRPHLQRRGRRPSRGAPGAPAAGEDPELPLWLLGAKPSQPRARATARMLAEHPAADFAPRALLMTGMLRLAACDLFIHGLGGGIYDQATERWMREWLGVELAPTVIATATLLLPIDVDTLTPEQIDRAQWARPPRPPRTGAPRRPGAAAEKTRLVQRINDLKRAGEDPSPAFTQLQQLLAGMRAKHAEDIAGLGREAAGARARRTEATVAHDRTWAFPLYPCEDLQRLKQEIEARFG